MEKTRTGLFDLLLTVMNPTTVKLRKGNQRQMLKPLQQSQATGRPGERRQSVRYPIAGEVLFQWKVAGRKWSEARGLTRNIGINGVFVECELLPPVATHLRLVVSLPSPCNTCKTLRLAGNGDVRHLQREACGPSGYGAIATFHLQPTESAGDDLRGKDAAGDKSTVT